MLAFSYKMQSSSFLSINWIPVQFLLSHACSYDFLRLSISFSRDRMIMLNFSISFMFWSTNSFFCFFTNSVPYKLVKAITNWQCTQFVELSVPSVSLVDLFLENVLVLHERPVSFRGLVLQNLQLVLEDLDLLFKLGQVLRAVLDHIDVLVPGALHFFIQSLIVVQLKLGLLLLFPQVQVEELFNLQLFSLLSDFGHSTRGLPGHALPHSSQVLDGLDGQRLSVLQPHDFLL